MSRLRGAVTRWLCGERLGPQLALLSVALVLPALWVGWQFDDHQQRYVLLAPAARGVEWWRVFALVTGDPQANRELMQQGLLPWWSVETLRLAFLRPLSALAAWLDYRLWPRSPALMHLHSLLWLAALVAAATAAYRRLLGPGRVAGLAALLYAVDEAHVRPAAWLANRNGLLAAVFGLLCLIAHDRWRRDGSRPSALLAPVWLALALLSGELALGVVGYLVAHAIFIDRGPPRRRLAALAPCGAVLLAWAVLYRALGFGASGSGLYVDPLTDPAGFAGALLQRVPFLLMGQWWPLPSDLAAMDDPRPLWWAALVLAAVAAAAIAPLVRRDPLARFWCTGMLLALVPVSSGFTGSRLLLFVGFGAMGLLASFLREAGRGTLGSGRFGAPARGLAVVWCGVHLVLAPLLSPVLAYSLKPAGDRAQRAARSLPDDPLLERQDLILVNPPDYLFYVKDLLVLRWIESRPAPRRVRALSSGPVAVELTALDERTLRVRLGGGLFSGPLGRLFRGPGQALSVGDVVRLEDVEVEITAVSADRGPSEMLYRFSTPLSHPERRWMRWRGGRYEPFLPPEPGRTLSLAAEPDPFSLWGLLDSAGTQSPRMR